MIRAAALWLVATPAAAFTFDGPLGVYDPAQLQRGAQVYEQVCAACHGLRHVAIRSLADAPAMTSEQVQAQADVLGLTPNDHFPESALPEAPDLSLFAKQQAGGAGFIRDVLLGYDGQVDALLYGNHVSGPIAMPPPLVDDLVAYADGTPATEAQMAEDVSAFLMWAAEPKLASRKRAGIVAVGLLLALAGLLWLTNREIWRQPR